MTIFRKMLIAPLLSLVFYTGFLVYSQQVNSRNNAYLQVIREDFIPLISLASENTRLFAEISDNFKEGVSAGEYAWVEYTAAPQKRLEQNLTRLHHYSQIVDKKVLLRLEDNVKGYYAYAQQLAKTVLLDHRDLVDQVEMIERVRQYHNQTSQQLKEMEASIQLRFQETVNQSQQSLHQLMVIGSTMTVILLLLSASVILLMSLSIRRGLYNIVARMKALADGSAGFGQRLEHKKKDELGELVYWFNLLSDKLEADYKAIETISITDKLTQLNNRSRTDAFFAQALADAELTQQPLSVILLDIDHFKSINDRFGHLVGDEVLQSVSALLKSVAQPHDFIGRWGGEEFILILPGKDKTTATRRAEQLRQTIAEYEMPLVDRITASFGLSSWQAGDSVDDLIRRADDNLYQAKERGRNQVII